MDKILRFSFVAILSMLFNVSFAQAVFDFDASGLEIFPTLTGKSANGITDGDFTKTTTSAAINGVTITVEPSTTSTPNRLWDGKSNTFRCYGGSFSVTSTVGNITKIEFIVDATKWAAKTPTPSVGTLSDDVTDTKMKIWDGSASSVVFTINGNTQIAKMTVYTEGGAVVETVAAPTISGETTFTGSTTVTLASETGTIIYYTTDGSNPTNTSTAYTAPFTINATTTVKAVAYKGTTASPVATQQFTAAEVVDNIAAFKALADKTTATLSLKDAQVLYADDTNRNVYIKDATGAICLYNAGLGLATGDIVNGTIEGTFTLYNNLPEFVKSANTSASNLTITAGKAPEPTAISIAEANDSKYLCDLVMISDVKLDSIMDPVNPKFSKLMASDGTNTIQVYDQLRVITESIEEPVTGYVVIGILGVYKDTYEIFPTTNFVTTGIDKLEAVKYEDAIEFNLAGQRVGKDYKGIVIRNGKKYMRR